MTITISKPTLIACACASILLLMQGCSSTSEGDGKINYRSETTAKTKSLDIPPDLTQLTAKDPRYAIPSGAASVSANSFRSAPSASAVAPVQAATTNSSPSATPAPQAGNSGSVAPRQLGDVRLMRDRDERWLHVDRNIDEIWPVVHEFWLTNGFVYVDDQPKIGLLETDWAENRAKIPMDFIRRTIGKVFDGAYSSGERDKFRIRVERSDQGGADIFVTHRGMIEEYADQLKTQTKWAPRARDTGLEAEFLSRLMVQLGSSKEQAQQAAAAIQQTQPAAVKVASAELLSPDELIVKNTFDVAWRRVGVALDRNGFTVEDRDRNQGLYFVRYVKSSTQEEPGFFSRMFSSSKTTDNEPQRYRIVLKADTSATHVTIQNSQGQADSGEIARNILKLLNQSL